MTSAEEPTDRTHHQDHSSNGLSQGPAPAARFLAPVLLALALGMATASVLGPVGLGLLEYRTSPTTLNQLVGSDAAALVVIAPLAVIAAVLVARGHRAGPVLGSGIGVYAVYTYAQLIIGQEYLRLPGNVEYWFPLLLGVFVLAEAATVLSWLAIPKHLPPLSRRVQRTAAVALLASAAFLTVGLHLPTMLTAWDDPASMTEYSSSPTPFWMVKLMDLGILVPVAIACGIGLLAGAGWARRVVYPLLTGYTCLTISVASMAVVMLLRGDPDASAGLAGGFLVFAALFITLVVALYRPLFHPGATHPRATPREVRTP
ncbi:hypothetical protein [Kocuria aegyptia]|uniref:Uncharacterized protein n=1 Tax=Kocuria aegyptia TaxID=330943 RepID=A0ABN2K9C8_9MICC